MEDEAKWFIIILSVIFILLVIFYNIMIWMEEKVLFYPTHNMTWYPDVPYHDLWLNPNDWREVLYDEDDKDCKNSYVHAWHFDHFKNAKTVIFCHGNSGNISHRSYIINICQQFKLNLLIFDYRGFGQSSGKPRKDFIKQDAETVYKYLRRSVKAKNIIVWGESLGGIAAVWIASHFKCRSLLLLSTFSGLDDALMYSCEDGTSYQTVGSFVASLASLKLDILPNKKYIRKVKCPVAIMHSTEDDIIPYQCAKILYNNVCHDSKVLITIKGKHSSPIITWEQLNQLFMFCDLTLPIYDKECDIDHILEELETVAEKHHLFMED